MRAQSCSAAAFVLLMAVGNPASAWAGDVPNPVSDKTNLTEPPQEGSTQSRVFDRDFLDHVPLENRNSVLSVLRNHFVEWPVSNSQTAGINGATGEQTHLFFEGFQIDGPLASSARQFGFPSVGRLSLDSAGFGSTLAFAPGGALRIDLPSVKTPLTVSVVALSETPYAPSQTALSTTHDTSKRQVALELRGVLLPNRLEMVAVIDTGSEDRGPSAMDPTGLRRTPLTSERRATHLAGRFDWYAAPTHTLSLVYAAHQSNQAKVGLRSFTEDGALSDAKENSWLTGLVWQHQRPSGLRLNGRLGLQHRNNDLRPHLCAKSPLECEQINPLMQTSPLLAFQNGPIISQSQQTSLEGTFLVDFFKDGGSLGRHHLVSQAKVRASWRHHNEVVPGGAVFVFDGDAPAFRQQQFQATRDPQTLTPGWFSDQSQHRMMTVSLEDHASLPRYPFLVFTPGVALVAAGFANDNAGTSVLMATLTPHAALSWDATHDNKTTLTVGYHHYVDPGSAQVAEFLGGGAPQKLCHWDPNAGDFTAGCVLQGGVLARTVNLPCGPDGFDADGNRCEGTLAMPRMKEWVASASRTVADGFAISLRLFDRRLQGTYEDRDTNEKGQPTRNGQNLRIQDVSTDTTARRQTTGVTAQVKVHREHLQIDAAYTWSQLSGNVMRGFGNEWLDNPAQDRLLNGPLPEDAHHVARILASYRWSYGLSIGATYQLTSGTPQSVTTYNLATGAPADLRLPRGVAFDDRERSGKSFRTGAVQTMGLQARWNLWTVVHFPAELWLDLLNVRDNSTIIAYESRGGVPPQATLLQPLRRVRLGLRVWF